VPAKTSIHNLEIQLGKVPALSLILINGQPVPFSRLKVEQDVPNNINLV
jgi:hypothetical protein